MVGSSGMVLLSNNRRLRLLVDRGGWTGFGVPTGELGDAAEATGLGLSK